MSRISDRFTLLLCLKLRKLNYHLLTGERKVWIREKFTSPHREEVHFEGSHSFKEGPFILSFFWHFTLTSLNGPIYQDLLRTCMLPKDTSTKWMFHLQWQRVDTFCEFNPIKLQLHEYCMCATVNWANVRTDTTFSDNIHPISQCSSTVKFVLQFCPYVQDRIDQILHPAEEQLDSTNPLVDICHITEHVSS